MSYYKTRRGAAHHCIKKRKIHAPSLGQSLEQRKTPREKQSYD
jgi:hypothetical protein